MNADRFQELCDAFLLHGLDGEELDAFRHELARRGLEGEETLSDTRETLALMALDAAPEEPPPGMREALIARIRDETLPVAGAEGARRAPHAGDHGGEPAAPRRSRLMPGLLAAASVAALALGVAAARLNTRLAERDAALAAARERLADMDSLRSELELIREDIGTISSAEGSTFTLAGTEVRPEARARIFVDPVTGRALVLAYELPILPAESVYQLWAIRDGQPSSVGTFAARPGAPARIELDSLNPVAGADLLAVTVEPAPGGPTPTGDIVLTSGG